MRRNEDFRNRELPIYRGENHGPRPGRRADDWSPRRENGFRGEEWNSVGPNRNGRVNPGRGPPNPPPRARGLELLTTLD